MHISTIIYTSIFGKFVGKDEYGNSYYRNYNITKQKSKRWVIYKGITEATKIPPLWHRWLHNVTDKLPNEEQTEKHVWQKEHRPNLTATTLAYHPQKKINQQHQKKEAYYQAWKPKA